MAGSSAKARASTSASAGMSASRASRISADGEVMTGSGSTDLSVAARAWTVVMMAPAPPRTRRLGGCREVAQIERRSRTCLERTVPSGSRRLGPGVVAASGRLDGPVAEGHRPGGVHGSEAEDHTAGITGSLAFASHGAVDGIRHLDVWPGPVVVHPAEVEGQV